MNWKLIHIGSSEKENREGENGYTLFCLLLLIAVLTVSLAVGMPRIIQEIQRDRELESLHRGQQYARAIRLFYRRTGNYPTDLGQLENTNNIRFLRKRYLDPFTGGPWKLVYQGEVKPDILFQWSGFFGGRYASSSPKTTNIQSNGIIPGLAAAVPVVLNPYGGNGGVTQITNPATGNFSNISGDAGSQPSSGTQGSAPAATSSGPLGNRRIVGVCSVSPRKSIRVYKKQTHYNDWQFIYDPASDGIAGGGQPGPNSPGLHDNAPVPPLLLSSQPPSPSQPDSQ